MTDFQTALTAATKTANLIARRTGHDREELVAEAMVPMLRAEKSYVPKEEKPFAKHVSCVVRRHLISRWRRETRLKRGRTFCRAEAVAVDPARFDLGTFLSLLSEDAQTLARLAVTPPKQIEKLAAGLNGVAYARQIAMRLREYVRRDLDWSAGRFARAWREVRESL